MAQFIRGKYGKGVVNNLWPILFWGAGSAGLLLESVARSPDLSSTYPFPMHSFADYGELNLKSRHMASPAGKPYDLRNWATR